MSDLKVGDIVEWDLKPDFGGPWTIIALRNSGNPLAWIECGGVDRLTQISSLRKREFKVGDIVRDIQIDGHSEIIALSEGLAWVKRRINDRYYTTSIKNISHVE